MLTHEKIVGAVKKAANEFSLTKVEYFGSYADGTQRVDSDIDICVVVPEFRVRQMETIYEIRDAISSLTTLPIDILAFRNDDFENRAKLRSTIQYTIMNNGVLLNG